MASMKRLTNTDQVKINDRQAAGNQPDHSTPTGTINNGSGGSGVTKIVAGSNVTISPAGGTGVVTINASPGGTGTVTSVTAGTALSATPNPIVTAGTINHQNYGTPGNYQRVTTNAQGHVTAGQDDVVNVKQYGAVGDGTTNDTVAINNAITALTSYGTLYFPAGKYLVTENSIMGFSGLTGLTICGDGWSSELYGAATGAPGNFLVIDHSCDHVTVRDLAIVGSATVRGNGICLRFYSSYSCAINLYLKGSSDFALHVSNDAGAYNIGTRIIGVTCDTPLGDGVHFSQADNCQAIGCIALNTGDDSFAMVADDPTIPPKRCQFVGCSAYNAGSRGFVVLEAFDFLIEACKSYTSVASGIELGRYLSTTAYCTRGLVQGCMVYNACTTLGPIGAINVYFCRDVTVAGNLVDTPATGSGMAFLDPGYVAILGNTIKGAPAYGIRGYTFGDPHSTTAQGPLSIKDNVIFSCADYAVYAVADTGCTITGIMVDGNEAFAVSGTATAVYWDQVTTGRIVNNTALGFAYTAGGTVSGVTTANNN